MTDTLTSYAQSQPGKPGVIDDRPDGTVVAVMNAARKIGAVAVPLNYRLTPPEALYVISHSDAEAGSRPGCLRRTRCASRGRAASRRPSSRSGCSTTTAMRSPVPGRATQIG